MSTESKKARQRTALVKLQKQLAAAAFDHVKQEIASEIEKLENNIASNATAKERRKRHIVSKKQSLTLVPDLLSEEAKLVASMPFAKKHTVSTTDVEATIEVKEQKRRETFWEHAPKT